MKTKLILILCLLVSQAWAQKIDTDTLTRREKREIKRKEKEEAAEADAKKQQLKDEADKKAKRQALDAKAAPLIKTYETNLESLNERIDNLNEFLANKTLGTDAYSKALAEQATALIKERSELKAKIDKLKINPEEEDFQESTVTNKFDLKGGRYTFLNGVNFDFNDSKTNYVGHFNIYVPYYKSGSYENKWGINVGILKINYITRDSIVNYSYDNVLTNPLDTPDTPGESYTRQYNRYTTSTKVIGTSFYAQPMYRVAEKGAANFYVHGHFELLWSKFEIGTRIKTIQSQVVTINDQNPAPEAGGLIPVLENETLQTINLTSPHMGLGLTVDFNFKDDCILFLQPTVGIGLNTIDRYPTQDNDGNYTLTTYSKPQGFFLIRSYFQYNTSQATQIIIGTDIRGILPDEQSYLSAYVGLNLGIDQIFK